MFSTYTSGIFGPFIGFANDMEALDLKEAALDLQRSGNFEAALPLMQQSVALREHSHTICLSLSELAELHLDMLQYEEAEKTAGRMLQEAHRYDGPQQRRIAEEILADVAKEKATGLKWGMTVTLSSLTRAPRWNGSTGVLVGKRRQDGRYFIDVGSSRLAVLRRCFAPED